MIYRKEPQRWQQYLIAFIVPGMFIVWLLWNIVPNVVLAANPGDLDVNFDTNGWTTTNAAGTFSDTRQDVAVQSDGKIVVVGTSNNNIVLVRYESNGSLDTGFGTNGIVAHDFGNAEAGYAVAVQSDGKILVAGSSGTESFGIINGSPALARYTSDGNVDTTFDTDGIMVETGYVEANNAFHAIALSEDAFGRSIFAVGEVTEIDIQTWQSVTYLVLMQYDDDGSANAYFNSGTLVKQRALDKDTVGYNIVLQPAPTFGNNILVVGKTTVLDPPGCVPGFTCSSETNEVALLRFDAMGSLDTTFDSDGIVTSSAMSAGNAIALDASNNILVAGATPDTTTKFAVMRFTSTTGAADSTFGTNGLVTTTVGSGSSAASGIVVDSNGNIVVAGTAANDFAIARYSSSDGSLDSTFGSSGIVTTDLSGSSSTDAASALVLDASNRLVVAGTSDTNIAVARYMSVATASNAPPTAEDDTATTYEETAVIIDVLDNDSDSDGSLVPATVAVTTDPSHGATSVNTTNGEITYTPESDFSDDTDSFVYTVCDDGSPQKCDTATVEITVKPIVLSLVQTAPDNIQPDTNDSLHYTVKISYDGPATTGSLVASIPTDTTFHTASDGGTQNGNEVRWTNLALQSGDTTRTFIVKVDSSHAVADFYDDMEQESGFWTATHATGQASADKIYGEDKSWQRLHNASKAHGGTYAWNAANTAVTNTWYDLYLTLVPPEALPTGARLIFWHSYIFKTSSWDGDGGVVAVSTNGGTSWNDLGHSTMTKNGYILFNDPNGINSGPLYTLPARTRLFKGDSSGYMQTIADVSSYAGTTPRFRFRMGEDSFNAIADGGWFIDDVAIANSDAFIASNAEVTTSGKSASASAETLALPATSTIPTPTPTGTTTTEPTGTTTPTPTGTTTPTPTGTTTPTPTGTTTTEPTETATTEPTETATTKPTKTATTQINTTSQPNSTATPETTSTTQPQPSSTAQPSITKTPSATNTAQSGKTSTAQPSITTTPVATNTAQPGKTSTTLPTKTSTTQPTATGTTIPDATVTPTNTKTITSTERMPVLTGQAEISTTVVVVINDSTGKEVVAYETTVVHTDHTGTPQTLGTWTVRLEIDTPIRGNLPSEGLSSGVYSITATARDESGNITSRTTQKLTVDPSLADPTVTSTPDPTTTSTPDPTATSVVSPDDTTPTYIYLPLVMK